MIARVVEAGLFATAIAAATIPSGLTAQHHDHHDAAASADAGLSERAREQIEAVRNAVSGLATPEAATRSGFREGFAWLPTMGTHWVSPERTRDGFDLLEPDQLMFSPVGGKPTLVGVAYAFRDAPGTPMPEGFDGSLDAWHDHPRLARSGETLHMLHLWFVESPDGPFAGHNPWLPFYAAGVEPPEVEAMEEPESAERIRKLAVALGATVERTRFDGLFERVADEVAVAEVEERREKIRKLLPALREARANRDERAFDHLADEAISHWEAIRKAYLAAAPTSRARTRLEEALDRVTGMDGHDGEH